MLLINIQNQTERKQLNALLFYPPPSAAIAASSTAIFNIHYNRMYFILWQLNGIDILLFIFIPFYFIF